MPRICIASGNDSDSNPTTRPIAIPKPASASMRSRSSQTSAKPPFRETGVIGQADCSAAVIASDSVIRTVVEDCRSCGSGTKAKVAATLVKTSRNPYSVPAERVSCAGMPLSGEAVQVSQNPCGKRHQLHEHPWQQQDNAAKERREPRYRAEGGVLNRGNDLEQTHHHACDR